MPGGLTRGRVLVMDDERGILDLMQAELSMEGYDVATACDGAEGVSRLTAERFDIVLSDVTMPNLNGIEALRRIRAIDPEVQVIMATGYGTIDTAVEYMKLGAFDFLQKPFEIADLLATVERALEARRLRVANSLYRASQAVLAGRDPDRVAAATLEIAASRFAAEAAALAFGAGDAAIGAGGGAVERAWPEGSPLAGEALARARACAAAGVDGGPTDPDAAGRRWIAHPIAAEGGARGALVIARPAAAGPATGAESEWAGVLLSQAALALQNARLVSDLRARIDEVSRARDQLIQSEKMSAVGQLAAGMVHDMGSPLAVAFSGLQSLQECIGPTSADAAECLDLIRIGVDQLRATVDNLKRFARRDTGEAVLEQVSLSSVARLAVDLARAATRDRCRVTVTGAADDVVPGRSSQLAQVIMNMVVNAAQAVVDPKTAAVDVRVLARPDEVIVEVSDNGPGIPPDVRARMFEAFFTTKPAGVGTGLGLSVSLEIVRRHAGTIEVDSEPGRGTTMRVRLPRPAAAARSRAA